MTPKELLFAHRYSEAVAAYQAQIHEYPDKNYYGSLGNAFLCLGRFTDATICFKKSFEIESKNLEGNWAFLNNIGTALWLGGDKTGAMAEWHRAVGAMIDESSLYGDLAGGAQPGLMLWYGAVTLGDNE
jgi:tetratricopeptide (TPR) repeat protein